MAVWKSVVGSLMVGGLSEVVERLVEVIGKLVVGILAISFQHIKLYPYKSQLRWCLILYI